MRVVSGNYKGKILKAVGGNSTRPTTDKVKESIFNMIGPYFDGGICLDLFAGSGGLGIEAMSRGIERAIFVDRDSYAIQTIHDNLRTCGISEEAEVYRNDFRRALKAIQKRELVFKLIFLDPPYAKQQLIDILDTIDHYQLLHPSGMIVCEHSHDVALPQNVGHLRQVKGERYGIIAVSLYKFDDIDSQE